jgi:plastocyanin
MRFFGGEQLQIKAGDFVTFDVSRNRAGARHTITFPAGEDDPDLLISQPPPDGPPALLLNPRVVMPVPSSPAPFDGSSFMSSGLLVTGGPTPQAWTVRFTQPGTFPYRCLFHDGEGMKGTIIVGP